MELYQSTTDKQVKTVDPDAVNTLSK